MSLLAASALAVLIGPKVQVLPSAEARVWSKVRSSVVTLLQANSPAGVAVCVDKRGYYIAHSSSVPAGILFAKVSGGPQIQLRRIAQDEATQLVLLDSPTLGASQVVEPVTLGVEPEKSGSSLIVVFPGGPVSAEFVSGEKLGVVKPSQRLFPLNELRFASTSSQLGGGLVFNLDGSLMGVLGATLGSADTRDFQSRAIQAPGGTASRGGLAGGLGGGGARPPVPTTPKMMEPAQFGPAPQTVAYSVSSSVLQRVVSGLSSPTRKVVHPAIGVFCRDGAEPGAQIVSITPGSPAEKAGLKIGDLIVAIGESPVKTQVDVGRITMRLRIGAEIEVRVKRGGQEMVVLVGVGTD